MRARHRVGHGVEPGLGSLGRRRACQSAGCHRAIVRSTPAIAPATGRAAQAGLWICGQRKGVAHIPTGAANDSQQQLIALKGGPVRTVHVTRRRLSAEEVRSDRPGDCAIYARIRAAIHSPCIRALARCRARRRCKLPRWDRCRARLAITAGVIATAVRLSGAGRQMMGQTQTRIPGIGRQRHRSRCGDPHRQSRQSK
jgi:hypothetical protein